MTSKMYAHATRLSSFRRASRLAETAGFPAEGLRQVDGSRVDMLHGDGNRRLHVLGEPCGRRGGHAASPCSLTLSASFSQTTPTMITASQTVWISVKGWSSKALPKPAAPTEPMPAQTA